MTPEEFLAEIGGVPFIDDATFTPRAALTAVAVVRRSAAPDAFSSLAAYLDPENGRQIYDQHAVSKVEDVPWTELPATEEAAIESASHSIVESMPDWRPFFAVPKRYRRMDKSTSSTSVLIPQTIYLGPGAFRDEETLRETLIHEHAHIWLNFIAEVFDLQVPGAPNDYVLPSGTAGKTYRGVMFAAHFAAAGASALHQRRVNGESHVEDRLRYLTHYLEGCLEAMDKRPHGSTAGDLVKDSLARRLDDLVHTPAHTAGTR